MGHGMGCPICDTMMSHHMGHHGMGGMMGGKGGMKGMFMKPMKMMMLGKKVGLSEDQMGKIRDIITNMYKQKVRMKSEIKVRKIDLVSLMMQDEVNMQEVEQKIREMANLKADMKIAWIQAMQDSRNVLTPDQRKKAKDMIMSCWGMGGMEGEEEEEEEEEPEED